MADGAFFDRSKLFGIPDLASDSNGAVYYRETVNSDATFEIRIKFNNIDGNTDVLEVKRVQNSVRIYENPRPVTRNPPGNCRQPF